MAEVAVASRVVRAEVYARGARVTRRLELTDKVIGAEQLVVRGVTAHAVASSLRVAVDGPGVVRGVRSRVVRESKRDPQALAEQLKEAEGLLCDLAAEERWLSSRRDRLERLGPRAHLVDEETEGQPRPTRSPEARIADALAVQRTRGSLLESVEADLAACQDRRLAQEEACAALREASAQGPQGPLTRSVTVELEPGELLPNGIELSYVVPTARWWPAYTVRLERGGQDARWQLEAFVCQVTGEAWEGVELSLATADLISDASFPDLPAQRLGRARSRAKAFRAPPEGLGALFAGYDRAQKRLALEAVQADSSQTGAFLALESSGFEPHSDPFGLPPSAADPFAPSDAAQSDPFAAAPAGDAFYAADVDPFIGNPAPSLLGGAGGGGPQLDEGFGAPAPGGPMRASSSRSKKAGRSRSRSSGRRADKGSARGGGDAFLTLDGAALDVAFEPDWSDPAEWLDYDGLEMQGADSLDRGELRFVGAPSPEVEAAQRGLQAHQPAGNPADPLSARGSFDHRYVASAPVDVFSGLSDQRVRVSELRTAVSQRLRCVPVVEERVYREAELINPSDAPLLAGPVEVYFDDAFLTRTRIDAVPRGGLVRIGLGEEERVRVVRRLTSEESAQGFLSGTTNVDHRVRFEIASQLGVGVELELLARVPVPGEDEAVAVLDVSSTPTCEDYPDDPKKSGPKGGKRFVVALAAGGSEVCELRYRLSFSAKQEVQGGNVRD